jgi:thiamine biosynthesis protein ThiS
VARSLPAGASVAALIAALGLRPEVVAVERNRALVPRERHAETLLADGDELELVTRRALGPALEPRTRRMLSCRAARARTRAADANGHA